MKWAGIAAIACLAALSVSRAQTFTSTPASMATPAMPPPARAVAVRPVAPASSSETLQLQMLTRKIDEQNAKIDILSQQILKLEQQISQTRPGIMIGESERTPTASTSSAPVPTPAPRTPGITTHTVARGETLTSIAKVYGVTIGELQRFNRIDDPLKLRAGQSLMIPPASPPAASPGE